MIFQKTKNYILPVMLAGILSVAPSLAVFAQQDQDKNPPKKDVPKIKVEPDRRPPDNNNRGRDNNNNKGDKEKKPGR
jgi:hypothetical protein